MGAYLLRRLVQLVISLLAVSAVVFFAVRLVPGDPIGIAAETVRETSEVERIRRAFGLDRPVVEQYVSFLAAAIRGDFGRSYFSNAPVADQLLARLPATIELALAATLVGLSVGLVTGLVPGLRPHSWLDTSTQVVGLTGISIPPFVLGLILMSIFSVQLQWLPVGGRFDAAQPFDLRTGLYLVDALAARRLDVLATALRYLALPAVTLGLFVAAFLTRITRGTVLEATRQDYTRTARAKGLSESAIVLRHALPNALPPIVTVTGLQFGSLLGGAVIIETVFSWPGLGKLLIDAINMRDYPQVAASVLLLATIYGIVNLAVDILYQIVDPRIRLG
ncbi:MAG: peptide ABC transporter permease [Candidatus Rokuibacteriota bacterium]|nr:MAG: peptide ABC transporter permease [Candidatus Rokubacteria bacterium]